MRRQVSEQNGRWGLSRHDVAAPHVGQCTRAVARGASSVTTVRDRTQRARIVSTREAPWYRLTCPDAARKFLEISQRTALFGGQSHDDFDPRQAAARDDGVRAARGR